MTGEHFEEFSNVGGEIGGEVVGLGWWIWCRNLINDKSKLGDTRITEGCLSAI